MSSGAKTDVKRELCESVAKFFPGFDDALFVEGREVEDAITQKIQEGTDLLIIYGGDGSALTAARLATKHDIPILPLPGGTMNILHKKLYGSKDWLEILSGCLKVPKIEDHCAGFVNADMFLVAAIIGAPARLAVAREAARDMDIAGTAEGIATTVDGLTTEDAFNLMCGDNPSKQANLLHITCPHMSAFATHDDQFEIVDLALESYADLVGLGLRTITTNWRNFEGAHVQFNRELKVDGGKNIDVLLDGELRSLSFPLKISLKSKAFKVALL